MVEVVAALIWQNGKFMICQRPAQKARGLFWEFVGGKVEAGETKEEARLLTLDDLRDDQSWIEYVYLFDEDEEWKYLSYPLSVSQIKDVAEDLDKYYKSLGLKYRPKNCYGILDEDDIAKIKKQQDSQGEL